MTGTTQRVFGRIIVLALVLVAATLLSTNITLANDRMEFGQIEEPQTLAEVQLYSVSGFQRMHAPVASSEQPVDIGFEQIEEPQTLAEVQLYSVSGFQRVHAPVASSEQPVDIGFEQIEELQTLAEVQLYSASGFMPRQGTADSSDKLVVELDD